MNTSQYLSHIFVSPFLTKGMIMKLLSILSVSVATVGMTCLLGYASAADSAVGDLLSDSMLMADGTIAPGGRGGGTQGEVGRADKGTRSEDRLQNTPGYTRPGTGKDTGPAGNTGSNNRRTMTNSGSPGSSTEPTSGSGSSGMGGSGSGASSGAGSGTK